MANTGDRRLRGRAKIRTSVARVMSNSDSQVGTKTRGPRMQVAYGDKL